MRAGAILALWTALGACSSPRPASESPCPSGVLNPVWTIAPDSNATFYGRDRDENVYWIESNADILVGSATREGIVRFRRPWGELPVASVGGLDFFPIGRCGIEARRSTDATVVWSAPDLLGAADASCAGFRVVDDRTVVFGFTYAYNAGVAAFSTADGSLLWHTPRARVAATYIVAIGGGLLFLVDAQATDDARIVALEPSGRTRWESPPVRALSPFRGTIVGSSFVVVDDHVIRGFRLLDGARVFDVPAIFGLAAADSIYALDDRTVGGGYLRRHSPADGRLLWKVPVDESTRPLAVSEDGGFLAFVRKPICPAGGCGTGGPTETSLRFFAADGVNGWTCRLPDQHAYDPVTAPMTDRLVLARKTAFVEGTEIERIEAFDLPGFSPAGVPLYR